MGFMMSAIRGLLLTIFVVLTPLSLANLLEYLLTLGIEIPWPLDMIFVPMLTFLVLLLITFIFFGYISLKLLAIDSELSSEASSIIINSHEKYD